MHRVLLPFLSIVVFTACAAEPEGEEDRGSVAQSQRARDRGGPGTAWPDGRVEVWDYTPEERWSGIAEPLLRAWEPLLGRDVKLVYVRKPARECEWVRKNHDYEKGPIAICEAPEARHSGARDWLGLTSWDPQKHQFDKVLIKLDAHLELADERQQTMCHELGHALTGMGDRYDARPESSCVMGDLLTPGEFDARFARRVYEQHGGRRRR